MRLSIFTAIILFGLNSLAAPAKIEIDSKFYMNGKRVGSPRILATEGSKAKVFMSDQKRGREYNLEVHPYVQEDQKIKLRYALAINESNNETLTRGIIKLPRNEEGVVSLDKGNIQIFFKVKSS